MKKKLKDVLIDKSIGERISTFDNICFPDRYTNNLEIYARKNEVTVKKCDSPEVVMKLVSKL